MNYHVLGFSLFACLTFGVCFPLPFLLLTPHKFPEGQDLSPSCWLRTQLQPAVQHDSVHGYRGAAGAFGVLRASSQVPAMCVLAGQGTAETEGNELQAARTDVSPLDEFCAWTQSRGNYVDS